MPFFVKRTDAGVFVFGFFFLFRVMCLLPVVNLACTFRYEPNKYVKDKYASVCVTLTVKHTHTTQYTERERVNRTWSLEYVYLKGS